MLKKKMAQHNNYGANQLIKKYTNENMKKT